jgi:hypothetical protein
MPPAPTPTWYAGNWCRAAVLGGVCFSLLALCWIFEGGLRTVPPSKDWIDSLLTELDALTGELR